MVEEIIMKHIIVLYDGMADQPLEQLGGKTPMEVARKPLFDAMGRDGEVGLVRTVPHGQSAGSDNTNLNILGYDSTKYYTGRSPIEAVSIGVPMGEDDVALRCNLVTLSNEEDYAGKAMVDYAGSEVSTEQARELIAKVQAQLGSDEFEFHAGVQYRHCLLWKGAKEKIAAMQNTPPHDIIGQPIADYLPATPELLDLMRKSCDVLKGSCANAIWLWGEGTRERQRDFGGRSGAGNRRLCRVGSCGGGRRYRKHTHQLRRKSAGGHRPAVDQRKRFCVPSHRSARRVRTPLRSGQQSEVH
jgi:2,3-bisphosphoglycerate-independent phosphoglycerate mutase